MCSVGELKAERAIFINKVFTLKGELKLELKKLFSLRKLPCDCEVRGHRMCKGIPVIPVDRVVEKKIILGKNGGPRRRKGPRGH
jgi:hypothetical protein